MKRLICAAAAAAAIAACGGSSSYSPSAPTAAPTPAPPSGGSAVTIAIVGSSGNTAYNPNPARVATGNQVMWQNNDRLTHHIVMDDGSADIGTLQPGASSRAITLTGSGGTYHCTIHPTMVGSINGQTAPQPPTCPDGYCG